MILAPNDPNLLGGFLTTGDQGASSVGRLTNVEWEEINRELHFSFEYELDDDIEQGDAALFILKNGRFYKRLANGETHWAFMPAADSEFEAFEFFLASNDAGLEDYLDVVRITNSVKLEWVFGAAFNSNDAKKLVVKHCYGSGTPDTTLATLTRIGAQYNGENASSGGAMYASGKWEEPDVLYTTIALAITTAGEVDTAEYTWTWGTWSGTGICRDYADHLINGVKVAFESGHTYGLSDSWTITVSLPEEWESGRLTTGGTSTFGVNSLNSAGDEATGPTGEVVLYIPPDAPTLTGTPVYAAGSGSIEITWTAPATVPSPLACYRIYRNWAHTETAEVDWAFEDTGAVSAGDPFTVTIPALEEGLNRICATVVDELGMESDTSIPWEITLNSSLNEIADPPNPPDSISARMLTSGNIEVTVVVDSTSDTINIYHDTHTGAVDYLTVAASVDNPREGVFQRVTATLTSLTDGVYLIGARCSMAGALEENTDMLCSCLRDKDTPAVVSALTARVVYE
jgi:hypothetical protein